MLTPPFSHQVSHSKLLPCFHYCHQIKSSNQISDLLFTSTSTTPKKTFNKIAYFSKTCYPPIQDPTLGSADAIVPTSQFHALTNAEKVYIWVCLHWHMFSRSYITIHPVIVHMKHTPDGHTDRESKTLPALHTFMLNTSRKVSGWNGENINVYHLYYCTLTANKVAIQNFHIPTKHYTLEYLNKQRLKKYDTKATHWNSGKWFCSSTFDMVFTYNTILYNCNLKPFITLFYIYYRYVSIFHQQWESLRNTKYEWEFLIQQKCVCSRCS